MLRPDPPPKSSPPSPLEAPAALSLRGVALSSLASGLLLAAAFPPLTWWPLAWVAPCGWLLLVVASPLPRRTYPVVYLSAFIFWLIVLYGVGSAHWATRLLGWPALCAYLALYVPLFVALARCLVHHLRIPLWLVAPVVWTGLEFLRARFATGFAMGLLGHTQVDQLWLVQISDITGAYGVSFVVLGVAAVLVTLAPLFARRVPWLPPAPSARGYAAAGVWGVLLLAGPAIYALQQQHAPVSVSVGRVEPVRPVRVGLVQGSIDTVFGDPTQSERTFQQYLELTDELVARNPKLDLIVWPETTTGDRLLIELADDFTPPPEATLSAEQFRQRLDPHVQGYAEQMRYLAVERWQTPLLLGTSSFRYGNQRIDHFNTALYVDRQGNIAGRYDKMHPVMFGEYVPLGDWFPFIYDWMPIGGGLTPGTQPLAVDVGGVALAPCICFENTVPHLVARQVRQLQAAGQRVDALVTLTNDGWFWGSSILDLHLTCARFRAIENRRPMLVAANTGISAVIDHRGAVRQRGPVRANQLLVAELTPQADRPAGTSWYTQHGDWFAAVCLGLPIPLCGAVWWRRRRPAA